MRYLEITINSDKVREYETVNWRSYARVTTTSLMRQQSSPIQQISDLTYELLYLLRRREQVRIA